jgi:hypothetical protein
MDFFVRGLAAVTIFGVAAVATQNINVSSSADFHDHSARRPVEVHGF